MGFREIEFKGRLLTIHKASLGPDFASKTVLVTDTWDYIDLWLKRRKYSRARFFWDQARHFYSATKLLPNEAAPLTAYYCMLNATKALLLVRQKAFMESHGVSGETKGKRASISNEIVTFEKSGVLPSLCHLLGESANGESYSLGNLLYNLVYIHRAYKLSLPTSPELFMPIRNPQIVRSMTTNKSWFCATLEGAYATQHSINKLGNRFEQDTSITEKFVVRRKKRFDWEPLKRKQSIKDYEIYHRGLRDDLAYIYSSERLWYLKRTGKIPGLINRSSLTIAFAAMHRLSELSRYSPDRLSKHFHNRYNWLLSEFIAVAPLQFLDSISSEMTGHEFMPPGRAN